MDLFAKQAPDAAPSTDAPTKQELTPLSNDILKLERTLDNFRTPAFQTAYPQLYKELDKLDRSLSDARQALHKIL